MPISSEVIPISSELFRRKSDAHLRTPLPAKQTVFCTYWCGELYLKVDKIDFNPRPHHRLATIR